MIRPARLSAALVVVPFILALSAPRAAVAEDTFASLSKEWSDAAAAYWEKVEAGDAKPESGEKAAEKPKYPYAEFAPRFKALASKLLGKPEALPPLFWLLVNCNETSSPIPPGPDAQWAIDQLVRRHSADVAMKEHGRDLKMAALAVGTTPLRTFYNAIAALNRDAEARAAAMYAMGYGIWMNEVLAADDTAQPTDTTEARERAMVIFQNTIGAEPNTEGARGAAAFMYEIEKLQTGMAAPELAGKDADGKELKLADLKGRVVVLKFWRYTCPDCRKRIPQERELAERLKDKPFTLLGVATDESPDALKKMLGENKINWPNIYDGKRGEGAIHKQWNILRVPTIYVIDKEGVIRHRDLHGKALEDAVEKLLSK